MIIFIFCYYLHFNMVYLSKVVFSPFLYGLFSLIYSLVWGGGGGGGGGPMA